MIEIHSFTNRTTNPVVKEALKFCTKLIKHVKSFPITNIQHGFLAKRFFENPYLATFSCLVQVLGLVNRTQSIFFACVEDSPYMKGPSSSTYLDY
jgi:hypothetical protein